MDRCGFAKWWCGTSVQLWVDSNTLWDLDRMNHVSRALGAGNATPPPFELLTRVRPTRFEQSADYSKKIWTTFIPTKLSRISSVLLLRMLQ